MNDIYLYTSAIPHLAAMANYDLYNRAASRSAQKSSRTERKSLRQKSENGKSARNRIKSLVALLSGRLQRI
ncbi:MAG: hypothetical protein EOM14_15770 [Clostridia bacterium]|nr:hypothetical protein [Clostridia bacterium]